MYVEIQFNNWTQYQRKADTYETAKWFKLSNNLLHDPLWEELTGSEFKIFVYLIMTTSAKSHRSGTIKLGLQRACRDNCTRSDRLRLTLEKLRKLGILSYQIVTYASRPAAGPPDKIIKKDKKESERNSSEIFDQVIIDTPRQSSNHVPVEGPVFRDVKSLGLGVGKLMAPRSEVLQTEVDLETRRSNMLAMLRKQCDEGL